MSSGRECELKYRIVRREDFLDLRDGARWGARRAPESQINHYFDTPDKLLPKSGILLRIRETRGRFLLTLKCATEVRPGYFDSLELEAELDPVVARAALLEPNTLWEMPLTPLDELRRRCGQMALVAIGQLANERVRREVEGHGLEIDRLQFPDGSETHELEIEIASDEVAAAQAWVQHRVVGGGILLEPETKSKLERFLVWKRDHDAHANAESGR
jgi:uncharacterized protein YjbK